MNAIKHYKYNASDPRLFNKLYRKAHPGILPSQTVRELQEIYDTILDEIIFITVHLRKIKNTVDASLFARFIESKKFENRGLFTRNKSMWLVYNKGLDISDALAKFIIDKNDTALLPSDYALLFYTTFEDEEVQENLKDIPLSMLYDMYEPLMLSSIDRWKDLLDSYAP
jgi:hypothetical protein